MSKTGPSPTWSCIASRSSHLHVIQPGSVSYLAFLTPGIIAQSALFISIFYGIQIIWDRDVGLLRRDAGMAARVLSRINPLSYEVDALRGLLIGTAFNPVDLVVLVVAAVVGIAAASTLLNRLVA